MAAKQKGGGQKKRGPQRQLSGDPLSVRSGNSLNMVDKSSRAANLELLMRTRREFAFALLVGNNISVTTRDGSVLFGVFSLHGNAQVLPQAWSSNLSSEVELPGPENTFVFVSSFSSTQHHFPQLTKATPPPPPAEDDDDGWRVVKQKKRGTAKAAASVKLEAPVEDGTSSSSSVSNQPIPVTLSGSNATLGFELFHSEARAGLRKQPCLWLRCAYRQAGPTHKSSQVYDWLAVPWDEVVLIQGKDIPDDGGDKMHTARPRAGFQTDAEISQATRPMPERTLQRWAADPEEDSSPGNSAEFHDISWPGIVRGDAAGAAIRNLGLWDQFSVNESKFGVKSTYVDGMYSTKLDEEAIPVDYRMRADKLADEMESNAAQRKQRSAKDGRFNMRSDDSAEDDQDDEARFSAVVGPGRFGANGKPLPSMRSNNSYGRRSLGRNSGNGRVSGLPAMGGLHILFQPDQRGGGVVLDGKGGRTNQRDPIPFLKRQSSSYASNGSTSQVETSKRIPDTTASVAGATTTIHPSPSPPTESTIIRKKDSEQDVAASRNVKDNINALNLEPIRSRKAQPMPARVPNVEATAGSDAQPAAQPAAGANADLQEKRRLKKAEFLRSLKQIETNLEKKGWTEKDAAASFPAKPAEVTSRPSQQQQPPENPPPLPSREIIPSILPQTTRVPAAVFVRSGAVPITMSTEEILSAQTPWPGEHTFSHTESAGTTEYLEGPTQYAFGDENMLSKRFFQFNPNAHSFTPKGNSSTQMGSTEPCPEGAESGEAQGLVPENSSRPNASTTGGGVKRPNILFKAFDPSVAEMRRRARKVVSESTTDEWSSSGHRTSTITPASDTTVAPHFFDTFLEAAREGTSHQIPSQVHPDWDNKLTISYTDLLSPEQIALMSSITLAPPNGGHPMIGASVAHSPLLTGVAQPQHFQPNISHAAPTYYLHPGMPTVPSVGMNPAAPPFTHVAPAGAQFVNLAPLMRPPPMFPGTPTLPAGMDPSMHGPFVYQHPRWSQPVGTMEGQTWVLPAHYPAELISYGPHIAQASSLMSPYRGVPINPHPTGSH